MRGMQGKGESFKIENKGFSFFSCFCFEVRKLRAIEINFAKNIGPVWSRFILFDYGLCTPSRLLIHFSYWFWRHLQSGCVDFVCLTVRLYHHFFPGMESCHTALLLWNIVYACSCFLHCYLFSWMAVSWCFSFVYLKLKIRLTLVS